MLLEGKTALITGSSGFLGHEISCRFASNGAFVLLAGRDVETLKKTLEKVRYLGSDGKILLADLSNTRHLSELVEKVAESIPGEELHVLVNNAHPTSLDRQKQENFENFETSFHVAVNTVSYLIENLTPLLDKGSNMSGDASIINVSSMYGHVAPDPDIYLQNINLKSEPWYGTSKAALSQLSRYYASFLGSRGIRVNSVSPGPFPRNEVVDNFPDFISDLSRRVPLGRIGTPQEMADCCVFLASGMSSFVTGHDLVVDGGWTTR